MKVGNLVRADHSEAIGLVVDIIQKKVWRAHIHGKKVNWENVDPEPHAVVLYAHNNGTVNIPVADLEVASESR